MVWNRGLRSYLQLRRSVIIIVDSIHTQPPELRRSGIDLFWEAYLCAANIIKQIFIQMKTLILFTTLLITLNVYSDTLPTRNDDLEKRVSSHIQSLQET